MCQKAIVDISTIQIIPDFVTRAQAVDQETVARYSGIIDILPDIKVWQHPETGQIFLLDGRHTLEANRVENQPQVEVIFVEGGYDDALVQSRKANITHGLPYTRAEWRQAVTDIVKVRYQRTNAWIAREAGCSAPTVARIRAELEEAEVISFLEYLEAEDGRMIQRQAKEEEIESQSEGGSEEASPREVSVEEEAEEEARAGVEAAQGAGPEDKDKSQFETKDFDQVLKPGEPVKVTLKLGRLGEPLAAEVGMWVDGNLEPVPVTVLITANQPKGLDAAAPGHNNCLIINEALARRLKLLYD